MATQAKQVVLMMVDISGYTHFIRAQKMSAIHAEEIIFELLEAVINRAEYPLILNKLEGDAVFLYAETGDTDPRRVARDAAKQALEFFEAFYERAKTLTQERAECGCNACQSVHDLRLKVVLHVGEAIFKTIRQFEELAGEDVITVHRLLKNSVPTREYILMTESFYALVGRLPHMAYSQRREQYEDLGAVNIHVFHPQAPEVRENYMPPIMLGIF